MPRITRKQNPPAFRNYKKYKPYLRIDFDCRCAYCHIPELRYGPTRNFTVDHFRPKSLPEFHHLLCTYSNLFYVCQDCNTAKGSTWPKPVLETYGFRFLDPCEDDFADHWDTAPDGRLKTHTREGEYMVARVNLNRPYLREWRKSKTKLLEQIAELTTLVSNTKSGTLERASANRIIGRLQHELSSEFGTSP